MTIYQEIQEQPEILHQLYSKQWQQIQEIAHQIGKPNGIFVAARGTSDNAARYAKYVWGAKNRIPVTLAAPSLFSIYQQPPELKPLLVISISQSGESPDLRAVIQEANQQGCTTLTITNKPDSPLAEESDFVIDILAGPELAVAATKSYTSQLMVIALLSAAWNDSNQQLNQIASIPNLVEKTLQQEPAIERYVPRYRYMEQCIMLGRGFNYATAYEWSLKLKEMTYIVAQPYSSADFKHGPIALVSDGFPVFAAAPQGEVFQDLLELIQQLNSGNQADIFLISDAEEILNQVDCPIPLPAGIPEWLSPLITIIPGQLFTYHLALLKHIDPDAPRGLTKVTKTL